MNIRSEMEYDGNWVAWDEDTYDGAPDADPECRLLGWGLYKEDAIEDLKEQMRDYNIPI